MTDKRVRDARDGRYVKGDEARKRPDTTITEKVSKSKKKCDKKTTPKR